MQVSTAGIVLSTIKYRETSVITKIYTRELGTQGYIVNGVRAAKARMAPSLFEPLTQLQLEVYHSPNAELHRIKEIYCSQPYHHIPLDPVKSTIRFFLAEFAARILADEDAHPDLFSFLTSALQVLDLMDTSVGSFPLQFMLKLAQPLGFEPSSAEDFLDHLPHPAEPCYGLRPFEQGQLIIDYLRQPFTAPPQHIDLELRRYLMTLVLDFWSGHLNTIIAPKSLVVLQQVLG